MECWVRLAVDEVSQVCDLFIFGLLCVKHCFLAALLSYSYIA